MGYLIVAKALGNTLIDNVNSSSVDLMEEVDKIRYLVERENGNRFHLQYKTIIADVVNGAYAIECTMRDVIADQEIVRVGEYYGKPSDDTHDVIKFTYDMAFLAAASDMLDIEVVSDGHNVAPAQPCSKPQQPDRLTDDTIVLIGNMKGRPFGEVKDTAQFHHFLEQLMAIEDLKFPDEARMKQLRQLRQYGKGVGLVYEQTK